MDAVLYGLLAARAHYKCECGCGAKVPPGDVELESTCWVLTPECHYRKTNNIPSAAHWLGLFAKHCERWGYAESKVRAESRLQFVEARRGLSDGIGVR